MYKDADLYDFINAPIGKGLPISKTLRPLIAGMYDAFWTPVKLTPGHQVPTTAGTGSETTGTAILDITSKSFKTGIASRALKPALGIVDTFNTESCPTAVHISAGLDVLFHSLESFTAIPFVHSSPLLLESDRPACRYTERSPRPTNPILRPAYQGSNPVADIFSLWALEQTVKYLPKVAKDKENNEARRQLLYVSISLEPRIALRLLRRLAASFAGIGFGNAGVHLCHGMSYPVGSPFSVLTSIYVHIPRFPVSTRKAPSINMLAIKLTTRSYPTESASPLLALPSSNLPRHPLLTGTAKHLPFSSKLLSSISP